MKDYILIELWNQLERNRKEGLILAVIFGWTCAAEMGKTLDQTLNEYQIIIGEESNNAT